MQLRLELFVDDTARSSAFYTSVLGFTVRERKAGGYIALVNGDAIISLNDRAALPADHPVQARPAERLGRGVEIVLTVADIAAAFVSARASGWPLASPLAKQDWGLWDFRLIDPDGYYLRLTGSAPHA